LDNICHTLVGAALAQAGLKRRTRFATATLLIGANLPDVDALAYPAGGSLFALSFRRGWTHGVAALLIWPFLLTGAMLLWHRVLSRRSRRTTLAAGTPSAPRAAQLWLLSAVSVLTHPVLDYLNTYGVRWLMPFSGRWWYGDALFIVDPWIWAVLAGGIVLSRRAERAAAHAAGARAFAWTRPARWSLAVVAGYAALMWSASALGVRMVERQLLSSGAEEPPRIMASPVPLDPFRRLVVIEDGGVYRFGTINWLSRPAFSASPLVVAKQATEPLAQAAARTPEGRRFLSWARFPFFEIEASGPDWVVHLVDARYTLDPEAGFGALAVRLPPAP
jgi:inner membrane protein